MPGANATAGEHRGLEEIVPFLRRTRELTDGTYDVELLGPSATTSIWWPSTGRVASVRTGGELDIEQALLVELDGARWRDICAQPLDQRAFDAFWT